MKCRYCQDTGMKDSGGETPWGAEIKIPCCCEIGIKAQEFINLVMREDDKYNPRVELLVYPAEAK